MYIFRKSDRHNCYYIVVEHFFTNYKSSIEEAFKAIELKEGTYSHSDCVFEQDGNYYFTFSFHKKPILVEDIFIAKLPDDVTYDEFVENYPHFFI